jgi:DNA-binding NarL/FixJ family response regulator
LRWAPAHHFCSISNGGELIYCNAQRGISSRRKLLRGCMRYTKKGQSPDVPCPLSRAAGALLSMTTALTRLVIADDHPLFRDALRQTVSTVAPAAKIEEAGSFDDLTALLEQDGDVDLILLDLTMPGTSGFSGLIYLRAQYPAVPVVVVSASDDGATIRRSLDFGASGFIPKRFGVDTLRDAILKVLDGNVWVPPDTDLSAATDPEMTRLRDRLVTLTPQQVRVLMMLSEGLLNKQIAYELGVSEATIKAHVSAILQKLGVESRTQAVIAAAKIAGSQWRQTTPSEP